MKFSPESQNNVPEKESGQQEKSVRSLVLEKVDFDRLEEELAGVFSVEKIKKIPEKHDMTPDQLEEQRRKAIFEVVEGLAKMALELKERIDEYDAILSDDASGRLVSLTLRKVLNHMRESEGKEKLPIYFLATGRNNDTEAAAVDSFLSEHKELKKVLVVSEYISSGHSANAFKSLLEKHGIDCDIATLSVQDMLFLEKINKDVLDGLIVGQENSETGILFYKGSKYSGVKKASWFSFEGSAHPARTETRKADTEHVIQARKDVNTVAEELYKVVDN